MASERQGTANRRNGQLGGPKTEAGKQRSRLNSLRHGLSSSTLVVLPEEDSQEFEEVLRGFRESFQPQDAAEGALAVRLAQAHWRSLRARRIETGMLNTTAATHRNMARKLVEDCPEYLDVHNAIGAGFLIMPPEQWQTYLRYDTTISREFFKTLDALTKLQRARQLKPTWGGSPEPRRTPSSATLAAGHSTGNQLSDSGIRSVSQNGTSLPDLTEQKELTHGSDEHKSTRNSAQCATKVVVTSGTVKRAFSSLESPFETV